MFERVVLRRRRYGKKCHQYREINSPHHYDLPVFDRKRSGRTILTGLESIANKTLTREQFHGDRGSARTFSIRTPPSRLAYTGDSIADLHGDKNLWAAGAVGSQDDTGRRDIETPRSIVNEQDRRGIPVHWRAEGSRLTPYPSSIHGVPNNTPGIVPGLPFVAPLRGSSTFTTPIRADMQNGFSPSSGSARTTRLPPT